MPPQDKSRLHYMRRRRGRRSSVVEVSGSRFLQAAVGLSVGKKKAN